MTTNIENIASPTDGATETLATCLLHTQRMYLDLLASDSTEQCNDAGKTIRTLAECIVKLNAGVLPKTIVEHEESEDDA